MDQGNLTGAVYMDLKKAFDTVHHGCLLSKLPQYEITQTELNWFTDYLFLRQQYVKIEKTSLKFDLIVMESLKVQYWGLYYSTC